MSLDGSGYLSDTALTQACFTLDIVLSGLHCAAGKVCVQQAPMLAKHKAVVVEAVDDVAELDDVVLAADAELTLRLRHSDFGDARQVEQSARVAV